MKTMLRLMILQITLFIPISSYCQEQGEWLVEMNTDDGAFEAVGPMLENVFLIYPGFQCKDETNGQYIFLSSGNPDTFMSVDISNGEVVDETPHPLGNLPWMWGFHCYDTCDTLVMLCRDDQGQRNYVALFDRFNGTEMIQIGDSIPYDNLDPWFSSINRTVFDHANNQLYMYSEFASILRVINIPSGEIVETYTIDASIWHIAFDEINEKLYGLEYLNSSEYSLHLFDFELESFEQIGNIFTSNFQGAYNYFSAPTIDGNNHRMFVTQGGSNSGSTMMSIALNTGELLTDVQTMPESGGIFGGPNVLNGQYFNSTNQLITLHWGEGSTITTTNFQSREESSVLISPNPNQGTFKVDLSAYSEDLFHLNIVNLKGQLVYEKQNLQKGLPLDIDLAAGYYMANVLSTNGSLYARIPFLVDVQE